MVIKLATELGDLAIISIQKIEKTYSKMQKAGISLKNHGIKFPQLYSGGHKANSTALKPPLVVFSTKLSPICLAKN